MEILTVMHCVKTNPFSFVLAGQMDQDGFLFAYLSQFRRPVHRPSTGLSSVRPAEEEGPAKVDARRFRAGGSTLHSAEAAPVDAIPGGIGLDNSSRAGQYRANAKRKAIEL
jgi:hypothetical protein